LRGRFTIETGANYADKPLGKQWQLVTTYLVSISRHFANVITTEAEFRVLIAPAVPFEQILSLNKNVYLQNVFIPKVAKEK